MAPSTMLPSMERNQFGKILNRIRNQYVIWTSFSFSRISNIKRAFAASFQIQAHNFGLLKITEGTIHGFCETEYLVTNRTSHYHIRKTVNLNTCSSHQGGIHYVRSNIPHMSCKTNTLRKIIVSNDAIYELKPHEKEGVYVSRVVSKGMTMVNIFEATGSAQYIVSRLGESQ